MLPHLLIRLPAAWRPPALLLATWRRWRTMLAACLVSVVCLASVDAARAELVMAILLYTPPILALMVMGGVFAHWRRASVWTTIAQRAGAGLADGWRLLALAAALYLVLLLPIVGLALRRMPIPSPAAGVLHPVERAAVFVSAWGIISFLTVATVAVLARRGVAGLMICWMAVPAVLAFAGPAMGLEKEVTESLAYLAPPFHAAARLHDVLMGESADLTRRVVIHLLTFPILCAGLITLGLQRLVDAPTEVDP